VIHPLDETPRKLTMSDDRSFFPTLVLSALAAALWVGLCQSAAADDGKRGSQVSLLPSYKTECAACHVAYPPAMLPAASWQRLMTHLPNHFGTDASLDPAQLKELSIWLSANAATGRRAAESPPEDRITRSAWFTRQHDEVPVATWKRSAIKSASNCAACHTSADRGDFNEHNVRIPR
jgi:cytochrome c553